MSLSVSSQPVIPPLRKFDLLAVQARVAGDRTQRDRPTHLPASHDERAKVELKPYFVRIDDLKVTSTCDGRLRGQDLHNPESCGKLRKGRESKFGTAAVL